MKPIVNYYLRSIFLPLFFLIINTGFVSAQQVNEAIRLNQLGFYPNAQKLAVVTGADSSIFFVVDINLRDTLIQGKLSGKRHSGYSQKVTRIADFSSLKREGKYVLTLPGKGNSYPFEIRKMIHREVMVGAIKGFYFQRATTALPETYAGIWKRPSGHPDSVILIHASAASPLRREGSIISAPRGWYDAGDYNKYIVNSGITMGTLLSLYEDFPAYFDKVEINIPEKSNRVPDILDEVLWNLRWMLSMQDPEDGGVYHKLTNSKFDGMVMPDKANMPRFAVQKGTAATLDFAAVMAQAARIYKKFPSALPGLSDSCLRASVKAWNWAIKHPEVKYDQSEINKQFEPDITTGAYGDNDFKDEFIWAASELYLSTKDEAYFTAVDLFPGDQISVPSWSSVSMLGYYSFLRFEKQLSEKHKNELDKLKRDLISFADSLIKNSNQTSYNAMICNSDKNFIWGSNALASNQGILLIQAYKLTSSQPYLIAALNNLDYILGRNATGYSFVTGFGDKTPYFPHHRPSEADGIKEPVPGLMVGGPNPGKQDGCQYPSSLPDEAYVDDVCSYASNEIAINWNAPLVYLAGALEVLQGGFVYNPAANK